MVDNTYDEQVDFQTGLFYIIYHSDTLCSLYKAKGIKAVLEELAKHPEKHLLLDLLESNMEFDFKRCEAIEKLGLAPKDVQKTIELLCANVSTRKEAQQAISKLLEEFSDYPMLSRLYGIEYMDDEWDDEMLPIENHLDTFIPDHLK